MMAITMSNPAGGTFAVLSHILIWVHANGDIPEGMQINHKDMDKSNNALSNLEIVTPSENMRHAYDNGRRRPWASAREWRPGIPRLTDEQKRHVVDLKLAGVTEPRITEQTGISRTHIQRIWKRHKEVS